MGAISAIGDSVAANHKSLKEGRSGISALSEFPSRYSGTLPCGEIKISTEALRQKLGVTEPGITRTSMLALHAFQEAVEDAALEPELISFHRTAHIGASTVGGMCLTDELYNDANKKENGSEYLSAYDCASVTLFLQSRFRMSGILNTINTACSSSANSIMYGARLMQAGLADRAIVGGVDSLAKFTINGFNSLRILSSEACAPFDENRKGLNLGEAAAFLVLEKEEYISDKKVYAELTGYGNANDAYHPSSLSPDGDGPYLAMQAALETASLKPEAIGYINAHGTGTENNDEVESRAMRRLFGTVPAFSSTKSNIGHTLGASGAIEAVYSVLALFNQELYPALNFSKPIPGIDLIPVLQYEQSALHHAMSNSFGFGGNCSSLIFSKV
jgi:3-oxoacyl-(acyl-carrier-protein) synthase